MGDRTECDEIQAAAYTARHVGQHLMRTGGTVPMTDSLLLSIALLLNDCALAHAPYRDDDGWHCEWDDDEWPCSDVKRAHKIAQFINGAWPSPAERAPEVTIVRLAEGGGRS
ncbi:hypothetical protein GCM10010400_58030 [Streptomyces aculeolatus]|uniref:hypothetical protein n=1 Tax=Streptomyces aculeolatus TaxID=270689 RepID=UPI001CEC6CA3|nr:hypothetical protein [Streptomyces aculeolatus]